MKSLILCNTGSDSISKIRLTDYLVQDCLLSHDECPVGPKGMCIRDGIIYTANSYNNTISEISLNSFKEERQIYCGVHPSDLIVVKDKLFVVCSDINSVIIYDLKKKEIILQISTGLWPINIEGNESIGKVFISNFEENTITVIDLNDSYKTSKFKTGKYPNKIKISKDGSELFVCECNFREYSKGDIGVYSTNGFELIKRIKVGRYPIDLCEDNSFLYVSNFEENNISAIDMKTLEEKKIPIGCISKSITKYKNLLFIGDYLNKQVKVLDLNINNIKVIPVGKEPNAMTLNHC